MTRPSAIPQANPRASYLRLRNEIDNAIDRVLERGTYILGEEVAAFEREFASYIGVGFGIGVGSGTEALHLALLTCGIGEGDEVVTVSHTAVATAAAIELAGAKPVFVDVDPQTFTLDPQQLESVITPRTRAVLPVHLYGHTADMDSISSIARNSGLWVIEDCAQSHGAMYRGRKTGAWGDIAAFSFYPTKNLGAIGDAGMVVTDHPDLAERARLLREYGWRVRNSSEIPGINSRLDELQATILRVKLRTLDQDNDARARLAQGYSRLLGGTGIRLPIQMSDAKHVYHQYVIRTDGRDELQAALNERGVGTAIHYPTPVHLQPAYRGRVRCAADMQQTLVAAGHVLSLPMYPDLSWDAVRRVAESIVAVGEEIWQ